MTTATTRRSILFAALLALGLVLALALWLRWQYVQTISLYVDEFTTLWAARRTLEGGAPIMPSGVLYTRGLLATYVTALTGALAGLSYTTGRLPSVFFGLATILALFFVGRREWNARVGWLAALGLALLPEAIVWSSRARFYAQLQFFVLLALWAAFWAMQEPEPGRRGARRVSTLRRHLIFALFFLLALFSQEETVLLYPPILAAMVFWRGGRYVLRREVWPAQLLVLVGMALRYTVEIVGQPGFFETIQAERPYVGFVFDVAAAWPAYAPLLTEPARLPWTLAALVAIAAALGALARVHWRPLRLASFHQATLFFALQFVFVLVFILTLVGGQWRDSRYLFIVQTCLLLVGAAGPVWLIDALFAPALRKAKTQGRPDAGSAPGQAMDPAQRGAFRHPWIATDAAAARWRWGATIVLSVLMVWAGWGPANAVLARQVEGYDRVFEYVAANRQPGDVVLTPQPPACAFVLGEPCDYYAVQRVYEEFVIPKEGVLVDRWSGAALLNDAGQLEEVIRTAPRVWLVTDGFRLATRYDGDFQRTVVEQFDQAFAERGVTALLAQGWQDAAIYAETHELAEPLAFGRLALTGWRAGAPQPGEPLPVELMWQATATIDRQLNSSLRLVAADGSTVAQQDGPPARGIIPTNLFFDAPLPDAKSLVLPADLPPGAYRLEVVVYDVDSGAVEAGPLSIGELTVRE